MPGQDDIHPNTNNKSAHGAHRIQSSAPAERPLLPDAPHQKTEDRRRAVNPPSCSGTPRSNVHIQGPPSVIYMYPKNQLGGIVHAIGNSDVLLGRDAPSAWHPGNRIFRCLVEKSICQIKHSATKRIDKGSIAILIVRFIRRRGGRFLVRTKINAETESHGCYFGWKEISNKDACRRAYAALRDRATKKVRCQIKAKESAPVFKFRADEQRDDLAESKREPLDKESREG